MIDNHVIRYTPPEEYERTAGWKPWWGQRFGSVVVGSMSCDPRQVSVPMMMEVVMGVAVAADIVIRAWNSLWKGGFSLKLKSKIAEKYFFCGKKIDKHFFSMKIKMMDQ